MVEVFVEDQPVLLPSMTFTSNEWACGAPPPQSALGLLLAEAQKALLLTQATLESRRLEFQVQTWTKHLSGTLRTMDSIGAVSLDREWPVQSAPAESLRVWGFAREREDAWGNLGMTYFGPDARVLFSDWFLQSRCIRLGSGEPDSTEPLLRVEFVPQSRSRDVEIAGSFVFDAAKLELRSLTFRWVGLPRWVPERGPGGELVFRRLPTGDWLAVSWMMRMPVPERDDLSRERFRHYLELGGAVTAIR